MKKKIVSVLSHPEKETTKVFIITFGYKYGLPMQADIVFDVRFIPNPFYDEDLGDFKRPLFGSETICPFFSRDE